MPKSINQDWEEKLARLQLYQQTHGNCQVDSLSDPALARWTKQLRCSFERLPAPLLSALQALNFDFQTSSDWQPMLEQLRRYQRQYHHCYVPGDAPKWNELYNWTRRLQHVRALLPAQQVQALDALGFDWQPLSDDSLRWQVRYQQLLDFQQRYGHSQVPDGWAENPSLAGWVFRQRKHQKAGQLPADRLARLQAIGFLWSDDLQRLREENWQQQYQAYQAFLQQYPTAEQSFFRKYNHSLYLWVETQRYRQAFLSAERKAQLDALGFQWQKGDYRQQKWMHWYGELCRFHANNGHCRVPPRQHSPLRSWVHRQRQYQHLLSAQQRASLNALGFEWSNDFAPRWQRKYEQLKAFYQQHGHCQLPKGDPAYRSLYQWVQDQKKAQHHLPADRRDKLEALGLTWLHQVGKQALAQWEQHYQQLKAFIAQRGPLYLLSLKEEPVLDHWVNRQLHNKEKLPAYKREKLAAIHFPWNRVRAQKEQLWESYYQQLVAFRQRFGHCRVNRTFEGYRSLASWVAAQRQSPLSSAQKEKLDALGFSWRHAIKEERWQQRLKEFITFQQQHGHAQVPSQSVLGSWLYQQRKHFARLSADKQQQLRQAGIVLKADAERLSQ